MARQNFQLFSGTCAFAAFLTYEITRVPIQVPNSVGIGIAVKALCSYDAALGELC